MERRSQRDVTGNAPSPTKMSFFLGKGCKQGLDNAAGLMRSGNAELRVRTPNRSSFRVAPTALAAAYQPVVPYACGKHHSQRLVSDWSHGGGKNGRGN